MLYEENDLLRQDRYGVIEDKNKENEDFQLSNAWYEEESQKECEKLVQMKKRKTELESTISKDFEYFKSQKQTKEREYETELSRLKEEKEYKITDLYKKKDIKSEKEDLAA